MHHELVNKYTNYFPKMNSESQKEEKKSALSQSTLSLGSRSFKPGQKKPQMAAPVVDTPAPVALQTPVAVTLNGTVSKDAPASESKTPSLNLSSKTFKMNYTAKPFVPKNSTTIPPSKLSTSSHGYIPSTPLVSNNAVSAPLDPISADSQPATLKTETKTEPAKIPDSSTNSVSNSSSKPVSVIAAEAQKETKKTVKINDEDEEKVEDKKKEGLSKADQQAIKIIVDKIQKSETKRISLEDLKSMAQMDF